MVCNNNKTERKGKKKVHQSSEGVSDLDRRERRHLPLPCFSFSPRLIDLETCFITCRSADKTPSLSLALFRSLSLFYISSTIQSTILCYLLLGAETIIKKTLKKLGYFLLLYCTACSVRNSTVESWCLSNYWSSLTLIEHLGQELG